MTAAELLPLIKAKGKGDRFSENLYKWVKKQSRRHNYTIGAVFSLLSAPCQDNRQTQTSHIIITTIDDMDGGFVHGARLSEIIGDGTRASTWAFSVNSFKLTPYDGDWWQGYIKGGKCWLDPEHRLYHDRERWQISEDGNTRSCLWCGEYSQHKHIKMVPREYWQSEVLR